MATLKSSSLTLDERDFLGKLPDRFTTQEAMAALADNGMSKRSNQYFISKMVAKGVIRRISEGNYGKVELH